MNNKLKPKTSEQVAKTANEFIFAAFFVSHRKRILKKIPSVSVWVFVQFPQQRGGALSWAYDSVAALRYFAIISLGFQSLLDTVVSLKCVYRSGFAQDARRVIRNWAKIMARSGKRMHRLLCQLSNNLARVVAVRAKLCSFYSCISSHEFYSVECFIWEFAPHKYSFVIISLTVVERRFLWCRKCRWFLSGEHRCAIIVEWAAL